MKSVKNGSKIEVDYEGKVKDGQMFDTSKEDIARENNIYQKQKEYSPMKVIVGETPLIKGFTDALIGMRENEEKEITIEPKEGYGDKNPQFLVNVPKENFKGLSPKKEQLVVMEIKGQQRPARVKEIKEDKIKLDFNHPLAGRTLVFKLKIVKIN